MTDSNNPFRDRGFNRLLVCGLVLFGVMVGLFWVGFLASDDATYARGAYGWIDSFPYVGGHGTIRYTITIPIALSFLALGENEVALALPSFLYALVLLTLLGTAAYRFGGVRAAFFALLFSATLPLLVIGGSIASIDIVEACFIFASFACFWQATKVDAKLRPLLAAGAFAALGFLSRETTIFLLFYYGLLFLVGFGMARRYYWIMAGSFLFVWSLEVLYLWIMTGDPLYRITISANHDSTIDRSIDLAGNIIVHPAIDPLLTVLFNQEFALLFWIAVPAGIWLVRQLPKGSDDRTFVLLWLGLAAAWLIEAGAAVTLLPLNPRYFMISALALIVPLALASARLSLADGRARLIAAGAAALLVTTNMAALYIENRNPVFGVKQYAAWAAAYDEPVYSDPETVRRSKILMRWYAAEGRVVGGPETHGALFFYDPTRGDRRRMAGEWTEVASAAPQPKLLYYPLEALGVLPYLPARLTDNLEGGYTAVTLYRLPVPAMAEDTSGS